MNGNFKQRSFQHVAAAGLLTLLSSCGDGGGGNTGIDPAGPSALEDNNAVATALAVEAQASVAAARRVPDGSAAAQLSSFVNGVAAGTVTISSGKLTLACALGGSIAADFPSNPAAVAVGTAYGISFNNCAQPTGVSGSASLVTNGSLSLTFSSLTNTNNFSASATYNITVTQTGGSSTGYVGNQLCSVVAGVATCTYSDGARTFSGSFSQAGGSLNGNYTWAYGTVPNVNFEFTNWTASGGGLVVTGPNKFRATVAHDGASSFTVTINGGVPRKVMVPG
jgi:hypothetical protein